jgi:mevalonate kinase
LASNEGKIDENFDAEYNEKIMNDLNELYNKAEKKILEELEKIQDEIEKLLENLMEEKLAKTLEINQKYENELRDLETDLDISIFYFLFYNN